MSNYTVTPTVSSSPAYSSGDCVGGKQTITSHTGKAILNTVTVLDLGNQKQPLTILFFNADPSAATITDNTAFAWSTDTANFIAKVNVTAGDYETVGGEAIATVRGLSLGPIDQALYAAVVTTGTPTYTSTTDLKFIYSFV